MNLNKIAGSSPLRDSPLAALAPGWSRASSSSSTWPSVSPDQDPSVSLGISSLIQLEALPHADVNLESLHDLPQLIALANIAMKTGTKPSLADGAMGGTYFLRDEQSNVVIVCKPGDEEHNSPHNPYHVSNHPSGWGGWYKGRIMPGFGMYREVAAFVLDRGFAGVPPTQLARVCDYFVQSKSDVESAASAPDAVVRVSSDNYKVCSVQCFVQNECSAEDMGAGRFSLEDVQRIAALDIRLCNLDRHEGNLLVCETNPYQRADTADGLHNLKSRSRAETITTDSSFGGSFGYGYEFDYDCDAMQCDSTSNRTPGPSMFQFVPTSNDSSILSRRGSGTAESQPAPKVSGKSQVFHLVPIDHGYVLPHVLYMGDPSLSWMFWPQCDEPLCEAVRTHVEALDFERDAELLRRVVGAALPDTSLLTLRVCTAYLKKCTAAGLTLKEMASAMCVDESQRLVDPNTVSPLQRSVHLAVHRAAACKPVSTFIQNQLSPTSGMSLMMSLSRSPPTVGSDDSVLTKRTYSRDRDSALNTPVGTPRRPRQDRDMWMHTVSGTVHRINSGNNSFGSVSMTQIGIGIAIERPSPLTLPAQLSTVSDQQLLYSQSNTAAGGRVMPSPLSISTLYDELSNSTSASARSTCPSGPPSTVSSPRLLPQPNHNLSQQPFRSLHSPLPAGFAPVSVQPTIPSSIFGTAPLSMSQSMCRLSKQRVLDFTTPANESLLRRVMGSDLILDSLNEYDVEAAQDMALALFYGVIDNTLDQLVAELKELKECVKEDKICNEIQNFNTSAGTHND